MTLAGWFDKAREDVRAGCTWLLIPGPLWAELLDFYGPVRGVYDPDGVGAGGAAVSVEIDS